MTTKRPTCTILLWLNHCPQVSLGVPSSILAVGPDTMSVSLAGKALIASGMTGIHIHQCLVVECAACATFLENSTWSVHSIAS
jgi:hypothetical protein